MDFSESIKAACADHALAVYPQEACGFIVEASGAQRYLPCLNAAPKPNEGFVIRAEQYADAEDIGPIVGLFHSHPGGTCKPSMADLTMCERVGIPAWLICALGVQASGDLGVDAWHAFGPSGYVAPLVGRPFVHGVHDCYSIVRDWYAQERGIDVPDFERADKWWENKGGPSLYLDNYRAAGFVDVGRDAAIEIGDVLLMTVLSRHGLPNHAGVYIGKGQFLHHMAGKLSRREVWGGTWSNSLYTVLRHKG